MEQSQFDEKWHYKLVKPTNYYNIPDKKYFVTACLLDSYIGDNAIHKFAIMAEDYSSENKHYITFDLTDNDLENLPNRFEILGDYNPISFQILFKNTHKTIKIDDKDCLIFSYKNFTNGLTGEFPIYPDGKIENIESFFDIGWVSTTKEKLSHKVIIPEHLHNKTYDEIFNSDLIRNLKYWIYGGLYHFVDFENLAKIKNLL